jgi:hypothetical protein
VTEVVLGEVLAAPSAVEVDGIAACLLDCTDEERLRRIAERAPDEEYDPHTLWDFVAWGVWLRFHHADPRFFAGPIRSNADPVFPGIAGRAGEQAIHGGACSASTRR